MAPLLLLAALAVHAARPADDGVRLFYAPENLWRSPSGRFVGSREGGKLVLVYDFFDEEGYAACPSDRGDPRLAPPCEEFQDAVDEALALWAEAAGTLVIRRRSSPSQPVNIWVAWTGAFAGQPPPVARAVDNSRDAAAADPGEPEPGFGGLHRPAYPRLRKTSAALFFNDRFCWHLDSDAACPRPRVAPSGKKVSRNRPLRPVALHEAGHVLGLGHFSAASIMGVAGGSERYELTELDRRVVRFLYERAAAF